MAQDLQADKIKTATNGIKKLVMELRNENKQLESRLKSHQRNQSRIDEAVAADTARRSKLRSLAGTHQGDFRLPPHFIDPGRYLQWMLLGLLEHQYKELGWLGWVEKELQFAKEVREAYERVVNAGSAGSSAATVSGSATGKRGRGDESTGLEEGPRKRVR